MKIFVVTASLDEVRSVMEAGIADGVMTTPMLLSTHGGDGRDTLAEICRAARVPVCAAVTAISGADIYREGRELARVDDRVVVQVPLVEDAPAAIHRLSAEGVRVAVSFVFSAAQALLAAKAGAVMVSTSLDQLDTSGVGSVGPLGDMRRVFDAYDVECDILVHEPSSPTQFTACATAGADAIGVRPTLLRSFLVHPLTDRGVDQFLSELSRRPRVRAAT